MRGHHSVAAYGAAFAVAGVIASWTGEVHASKIELPGLLKWRPEWTAYARNAPKGFFNYMRWQRAHGASREAVEQWLRLRKTTDNLPDPQLNDMVESALLARLKPFLSYDVSWSSAAKIGEDSGALRDRISLRRWSADLTQHTLEFGGTRYAIEREVFPLDETFKDHPRRDTHYIYDDAGRFVVLTHDRPVDEVATITLDFSQSGVVAHGDPNRRVIDVGQPDSEQLVTQIIEGNRAGTGPVLSPTQSALVERFTQPLYRWVTNESTSGLIYLSGELQLNEELEVTLRIGDAGSQEDLRSVPNNLRFDLAVGDRTVTAFRAVGAHVLRVGTQSRDELNQSLFRQLAGELRQQASAILEGPLTEQAWGALVEAAASQVMNQTLTALPALPVEDS